MLFAVNRCIKTWGQDLPPSTGNKEHTCECNEPKPSEPKVIVIKNKVNQKTKIRYH